MVHMGAHALGAAAYAAKAVALAADDGRGADAAGAELERQLERMTEEVASALRRLPLVGEDSSGPLGSGLLASGDLGQHIRRIQSALRAPA